jgi:hypothetical protein
MTAPGTAGGFTLGTDTGLRGYVQSSSSTVLSGPVPGQRGRRARRGVPDDGVEMTGGTYWLWSLTIFPAGGVDTWGLEIFDGGGSGQVFNSVAFSINGVDEPYGRDLYFMLDLRQNGGNVEYEFRAYDYTQGAASGRPARTPAPSAGGQLVVTPTRPGRHRLRHQVQPDRRVRLSSNFAAWAIQPTRTTPPATWTGSPARTRLPA